MHKSSQSQPEDNTHWPSLLLMAAFAAALFVSVQIIPEMLGGPAGSVLTVIVGGVFLYSFGKQTGSFMGKTGDRAARRV